MFRNTPLRLVVDTNLLVSQLFWASSPIRPLVRFCIEHHTLLRSVETYAELSEVVMRPQFDRYLSPPARQLFLNTFYEAAQPVTIEQRVTACRDPKDNKFLELAVSGKADFLFSGDADLQTLREYAGIPILSPVEARGILWQ